MAEERELGGSASNEGDTRGSLPITLMLGAEQVGERLDRVVAGCVAITRSQAKMLIDHQRVWVDGKCKKAGYPVRLGERLCVFPLPPLPISATPQDIALDILYEDDFLVAINKPAGMVVHPAPGQWQDTVVNALLFRWGWQHSGPSLRPGIVHRLDKNTSGVLLVAKDARICEQLAKQFQARRVHKTYAAIVVGRFAEPTGVVTLPIGRHPSDRKKMSIHARHSRSAVSRYQVMAEAMGVSFVRLFPHTGRTHQLRVHMAALGHPLIGDTIYGFSANHPRLRAVPGILKTFPHQALHAESIQFQHPASGAMQTISAPFPDDFVAILAALGMSHGVEGTRFTQDSRKISARAKNDC